MKLGTFAVKSPVGEFRRIGVATPDGIVDATAARIALLERSLPPGDVVELRISRIGSLVNRIGTPTRA